MASSLLERLQGLDNITTEICASSGIPGLPDGVPPTGQILQTGNSGQRDIEAGYVLRLVQSTTLAS